MLPDALASVMVVILAIDELEGSFLVEDAVGVVAAAIALSVLLRGVTAGGAGRRRMQREDAGPVAADEARWAQPSGLARAASGSEGGARGP
jgi:hypothetical protein